MAADPIRIVEQRTTAVSREEYRELEDSPAVQELIEGGVLTLLRSRTTTFGARAGAYVGQAVIDGERRLIIEEKSPGALEALLHWSVPEDFREVSAPSPIAYRPGGALMETFARRFLTHLAEYVRHGRLKEYRPTSSASSRPRGRIDVRSTARLRAKGDVSRVAFVRPQLTADLLPNRLLALCLVSIETIFRLQDGATDVVETARFYAPLFEDVDRIRLERREWGTRAAAFREAFADDRVDGELKTALAYARALVLNLGPWPDTAWAEGPPTSFFLNLQTLFEDAVRQLLASACDAPVARGRDLEEPLFEELPGRYIVDPDVAIGPTGGVQIVLDCKYKDLDKYPGHDDVYQVAAHAAALNCQSAVLLYPGASVDLQPLGTTAVGVHVEVGTVRMQHLKEDVAELARRMGVVHAVREEPQ